MRQMRLMAFTSHADTKASDALAVLNGIASTAALSLPMIHADALLACLAGLIAVGK